MRRVHFLSGLFEAVDLVEFGYVDFIAVLFFCHQYYAIVQQGCSNIEMMANDECVHFDEITRKLSWSANLC